MKALELSKVGGTFALVKSKAKPTIQSPNDIVVKLVSSALNPVDHFAWQLGFAIKSFPCVLGSDGAGTVEAVGEAAKAKFKIGDRVAIYTGVALEGGGTLAEFARARAELAFKLPDTMGFDEASTLATGALTASLMYYHAWKGETMNKGNPVLVYGASSSVGLYAVQIAKLEGRRVIGVASKKNHELLRSLGADLCMDYHDKDWEERVVEALGEGSSPIICDMISNKDTVTACANIAAKTGSKQVVITMPPLQGEYSGIHAVSIDLEEGPRDEGAAARCAEYTKKLTAWINEGKFKPNPVKLVPGGLGAVENALNDLKNGKISAAKYVVRVQE